MTIKQLKEVEESIEEILPIVLLEDYKANLVVIDVYQHFDVFLRH